jgi:hypothetical protein
MVYRVVVVFVKDGERDIYQQYERWRTEMELGMFGKVGTMTKRGPKKNIFAVESVVCVAWRLACLISGCVVERSGVSAAMQGHGSNDIKISRASVGTDSAWE